MNMNEIIGDIVKEASIPRTIGRAAAGSMIGASLGMNKGVSANEKSPGLSEDGQATNIGAGTASGALIGAAAAGPGVGIAKKGFGAVKNLATKVATEEKVSEMEVPTDDEKKKENNEVSDEEKREKIESYKEDIEKKACVGWWY